MKYVALLSGGKDSCYNLLHCHLNGHQLVAAASLGPEHGKEELDSYLYQTVGQDAIEYVARALDVPLYRRVISGTAVEQGSEYGGRDAAASGGVHGDETEDLYTLLSFVKLQHPDIQGVSVGAILSNYQRVRVEHVCQRLSLTPLCYLWQRDQAELLSEMIDSGMEAILIKVAGIGLTVKHLGKTLAQIHSTLVKLNALYGSHICGEGGEYETLTLDCAMFKRRIRLNDVETILHSDNDFATVAYLRIKNAELEEKVESSVVGPTVPPLLSEEFHDIRDAVESSIRSLEPIDKDGGEDNILTAVADDVPVCSSKRVGRWVAVANVQHPTIAGQSDGYLEDEVRECFLKLEGALKGHGLRLAHCAHINIYISSIDLFARVNAVYKTFFGTSPPSRACVAVDLPIRTRVRLDCIAFTESSTTERQALHVQSLSYWAPANIGPYSQAIVANERIFLSGQIGLRPSDLTLPTPQSLAQETGLSCQHVERIVDALRNNSGGGWTGYHQGIIYWLTKTSDMLHVRKASQDHPAPVLFAVVSALPKGAIVEKQVLSHTGQCLVDDDGDQAQLTYVIGNLADGSDLVHWEVSRFSETESTIAMITIRGDFEHVSPRLKKVTELREVWERSVSCRLFYHPGRVSFSIAQYDRSFDELPPPTLVPCRQLATKTYDDWDYVLFITCS
ncbi:hypothetical protein OBBRIDRAFT_811409 [Obba rivulosa]|uniref:Diphthine--ammonia ligase n=1 Tax=Obba rivulosa TaxID=1052685 RepID=A0A8E2DLT9_9APHY|nr:hypothetical protein OBBRIDRAFT_811409 [Obba rivulosa]